MRQPPSDQSRRGRRLPPMVGALLVGATTTALILTVYWLGGLRRIDNLGYDTFFRALGGIEADPRILLVDIDDSTLKRIGRWPWDRRKLAGMIDVLSDLGASHIVLDMTFRRPQPVRVEAAPSDSSLRNPVSATRLPTLEASGLLIRDDDELAAAMARAANVYFGIDYQPLDSDPAQATSAGRQPSEGTQSRFTNAAMHLVQDFSLTEAELRRLVHWPQDEPLPLAELKAFAARTACNQYMSGHSVSNFDAFLDQFMPGHAPAERSPDVEELRMAFAEAVSAESLRGRWRVPHSTLPDFILRGARLNAPVAEIGQAARGIGSVVYQQEESAPIVRSLPLIVRVEQQLVPHLALATAGAIAHRPIDTLYWNGRTLESTPDTSLSAKARRVSGNPEARGDAARRQDHWLIPIGEDGTTLVPWAMPSKPGNPTWLGTFRHVSAGRLMEYVDKFDSIEENDRWLKAKRSDAVHWATRLTQDRWEVYADRIRERNLLTSAIRLARNEHEVEELLQRVADLTLQVADEEKLALQRLDDLREPCRDAEAGGNSFAECREIASFEAALTDSALTHLQMRQERLQAEAEALRRILRPEIEGRVCLVGLVGTGAADFVSTPMDSRCPGVAVHAHMLNALLQDRFVRPIGAQGNLLILFVLGAAAAFAASKVGLVRSLFILASSGGLLVSLCALLFRREMIVVSWAPGLVMLAGVWVAVIAYRQATEERQRRRVTRMLAQYTSPAVAAGIAERLDDRGFAPQRRIITCFFSDLGDFTAAAERLDPEETRRLLQPYLERVSNALIAEEALVNKFIGDGVFAFFNAPLLPCTDQAARACRAALACLRATSASASHASNSANPSLPVRIGIATGEAIVGDFGTDRKRDYTSIGDTVNVASRLEAANKTLGTSILVSDSARQAAGDGFAFRPVGRLRVAGRVQAVQAFELLGDGSTREASQATIRGMETVLEHFSNRRWSQARAELEALLALNAGDGAARFYLRAIERLSAASPEEGWRGEVEVGGR
ncbi:MAG: CHASE2 domain-containing protein [Phycisphaerales bacterium]|nr:CHASE2 domain-containing protein [Phycisphaerales bacterium]